MKTNKVVTCMHCDKTGLAWGKVGSWWRLHTADGELHICKGAAYTMVQSTVGEVPATKLLCKCGKGYASQNPDRHPGLCVFCYNRTLTRRELRALGLKRL